MKIHIDIGHPAQLNFYKNAIIKLAICNKLYITYLNRGKLPIIVQKELGNINNCHLIKIGKHKGTKLSILLNVNIIRTIKLLIKCMDIKPDIEMSNGYQAGLYSKISGIPSIHFSDDPERGWFFIGLMKFFAKEIYMPFYSDKKIKPFFALKEWAYLSPNYFTPKDSCLSLYGIKRKEYIFVREVITNTINYKGQASQLIESFANLFPDKVQVILSLEDKTMVGNYPKNWIILKEPIDDIHSLIYHSRLVISSGDSIAREGAILGVPSIYCGTRDMHVNKILIQKKILQHVTIEKVPALIQQNILLWTFCN